MSSRTPGGTSTPGWIALLYVTWSLYSAANTEHRMKSVWDTVQDYRTYLEGGVSL
jgi:hypothetical protein